MKYSQVLVVVTALAAVAACQPKGAATSGGTADSSPALATVNGTPISQNFFDFYVKAAAGKQASAHSDDQKQNALDNLIRAQLVAQQAVKDGVDKNADTEQLLELTRLNVL